MKERKDKTQFTQADLNTGFVTDYSIGETIVDYSNSETIVEYNSEIDPTMPASEPMGKDSRDSRDPAFEEDSEDYTVVDDRLDMPRIGLHAQKVRPAVGWLACTRGPCAGIDYRLHANYNKIGRNAALDVNVEDPKFSKSSVAWVGYFRETNAFFVGAESSTNVLYVNGVPLPAGQSREFFAWDRIRMGDTELVFVPLCGEKFTWDKIGEGEQ